LRPTGDGYSESLTDEQLDDDSPPDPQKPKSQKPRELASLESSVGDAWKPPAEGSQRNRGGLLANSAQLLLEDEEFECTILIDAGAASSDNHDDGINRRSYNAATESPLTENWDMVMKDK
jgi:hypothetical protein